MTRCGQIKRLHAEKEELEQQVELLKARCKKIEEEAAEQRALDEKKHADEVSVHLTLRGIRCDVHLLCAILVQVGHYKSINDNLKRSLEQLLAAPKK